VPIEDVDVPQSAGWWLKRLSRALNARPSATPSSLVRDSRRGQYGRRDWMDLLWSYRTGEPPLPRVSREHREATREFLRMARANYASLSIDALLDRTNLLGVRTGADGDSDGDDVVRRIMANNGPWLSDALDYAYSMREGFVMVGPNPDDPGSPIITAEDPRQVIMAADPARPDVPRAVLKLFRDDDMGEDIAHLFLRGGVDPVSGARVNDRLRVAVRTGRPNAGVYFSADSWEWDESQSGDLPVQGFGLPVVPFVNRLGMGEFEPHLDLLDRINNMIADRLWTSKFQTFRQMAVQGDLPDKDENGNEIDYDAVFESDPGAMWRLPDGVSLWQSQTTDMTPILAAVRDDVKEFASGTRTPLFMFTPDAAAGSAEGASLMREGLVFKAEDRTARMTPPVLRVARLMLAYAGEADRAQGELQAMWAPAERYSLAQRGSAAVQAAQSGVPTPSILSDVWQFPPATTARMKKERAADMLYAAAKQPPVAPTMPTFQAP